MELRYTVSSDVGTRRHFPRRAISPYGIPCRANDVALKGWLQGNCDRRVYRGGSRVSNPRDLRAANRNSVRAGYRSFGIGFRVARTLTP